MSFDGRIGEIVPGYKADIVFLDLGHINYVPCHDLVGCGVERFGDILEIDAMLAAIGHRDAPVPRFRCWRNGTLRQREQLVAQGIEADLGGIIMHQQRPIGRDRLGHAQNWRLGHRAIERQHTLVGGIVDVAGKFHRDGGIATRQ